MAGVGGCSEEVETLHKELRGSPGHGPHLPSIESLGTVTLPSAEHVREYKGNIYDSSALGPYQGQGPHKGT